MTARSPEAAVALLLEKRRLIAAVSDVHFLEPCPSTWNCYLRGRGVIVRARRADAPPDIFLLHARASLEERTILGVSRTYNATNTRLAEETELVVQAPFAAWTIADGERSQIFLIDTSGERLEGGADWTTMNRVQNALTNFQETGQFIGVGRRTFEHPLALGMKLRFTATALIIETPSEVSEVPLDQAKPIRSVNLKETTQSKGRPGNLVTWAVDRVRAIPWIGAGGVEWAKAVASRADDQIQQIKSDVLEDDGKADVEEALGSLNNVVPLEAHSALDDWPPPRVPTLFKNPLPAEGQWASLEEDPFVSTGDGHTPFAATFLRVDPKRPFAQIYITLWDPRRVGLHMVSGTVEPKSATGEVGTGLIPRDPKVLERVVAAFNGAFQAMHGEFGMMASDVVYLPPKPYAATVAEMRDGATGFGTWPDSNLIPSNIVSFRQNLSPLIVDGQTNPYRRHWWGGMPEGWTQESRTVRSALCLTRENFVGYFYGNSSDPDQLAKALQLARCTYGIQLDMNSGHCGLEFYKVAKKGTLPPLAQAVENTWQAEGEVPKSEGHVFRARLMTKSTTLMNFPRYINPSTRDFFYLTLREKPLGKEEAVERLFPETPILPPSKWAYLQARPAKVAIRQTAEVEGIR